MFGFFIYESDLAEALSSVHPSLFLKSTSVPGLSGRLGLLKQNYVAIECYLEEDPDDEYYEELS